MYLLYSGCPACIDTGHVKMLWVSETSSKVTSTVHKELCLGRKAGLQIGIHKTLFCTLFNSITIQFIYSPYYCYCYILPMTCWENQISHQCCSLYQCKMFPSTSVFIGLCCPWTSLTGHCIWGYICRAGGWGRAAAVGIAFGTFGGGVVIGRMNPGGAVALTPRAVCKTGIHFRTLFIAFVVSFLSSWMRSFCWS